MVKFNVENTTQEIDDEFLPNFPTSGTVATDMNLDSFLILKRFIETSVFDPFYYSIFEDRGRTYQLYFDSLVEEQNIRDNLYAEGNEDEDLLDENHNLISLDEKKFASLLKSREAAEGLQKTRLKNPNFIFPDAKLKPRPWSEVKKYLNFFDSILTPNTIVAGGSVFLSLFEGYIEDVDLFIYGLNENDAKRKIIEICDILRTKYDLEISRSNGAVTFTCSSREDDIPHIKIQVILRLYKRKYEIIHGFDVDSCCIGYDGKSIIMTPRCQYALTQGFNTVNFERLSPSYAYRLIKYANRGMRVLDYGFSRDKFLKEGGKEKILKFENEHTNKYTHKEYVENYYINKGLNLLLIAEDVFEKHPNIKFDYEVNRAFVGGKERDYSLEMDKIDYTTHNFLGAGSKISDYENKIGGAFGAEDFKIVDKEYLFLYNNEEYPNPDSKDPFVISYPRQIYQVVNSDNLEFRTTMKPKIEFKNCVLTIKYNNGKSETKYFFDYEELNVNFRDVNEIYVKDYNSYQEMSRDTLVFPANRRIYNVNYYTRDYDDFSPFVIFKIPKAQYESILKASEKIRKKFGQKGEPELLLKRKLEFKKINPGEQATSTFNVLVLEDPEEWYNGNFYTL